MKKTKMHNERIHLRSPNINVCLLATIKCNLSQDDFQRSIDIANSCHPIVNSTIKIDDEGNAWYLPGNKGISLEYFNDTAPDTWREWYEKTDAIPFDFVNGPLVKMGVFCRNNESDLVLIGHHILGDGIGYLNLLKSVLLTLDSKTNNTPLIPPEKIILKSKSKIGLLPGFFTKRLNRSWRKNVKIFSHDDYLEFFRTYREKNTPGMYLSTINETQSAKLFAACRSHGITVNEAIATAFVAALQAHMRPITDIPTKKRGSAAPPTCATSLKHPPPTAWVILLPALPLIHITTITSPSMKTPSPSAQPSERSCKTQHPAT